MWYNLKNEEILVETRPLFAGVSDLLRLPQFDNRNIPEIFIICISIFNNNNPIRNFIKYVYEYKDNCY